MPFRSGIKLIFAVFLFGFIAYRVDFSAAIGMLGQARAPLLLLALAASLGIMIADALFWTWSMSAVGFRIGLRSALMFSLVGWFFANLAPSTLGADLFRAGQMRLAGASVSASVRVVAAARLMSFASLLLVIGAGAPLAFGLVEDPLDQFAIAGALAASILGFAAFILLGPLLPRLPKRFRILRPEFAGRLAADTKRLLTKGDPAQWSFLTAQHLLRIAGVAFLAAALGAPVSLAALFALIPTALLIAMIPVSFGGWGVREASFIYFLGLAGVDSAAALAISIAYGLIRVLIGAAGGAVWLIARAEHYRFAMDPGLERIPEKRARDQTRI